MTFVSSSSFTERPLERGLRVFATRVLCIITKREKLVWCGVKEWRKQKKEKTREEKRALFPPFFLSFSIFFLSSFKEEIFYEAPKL